MNPEDLIENNVYIARCSRSEWDSMFVFKGLNSNSCAKIEHRVYLNRQVANQNNVVVDDTGSWLEDTKFEIPSQELIDWFWKRINNKYYFEKPKYDDNLILIL